MATIKTIKPDGTGDFTTLAAWNTFAAAQATADQWAECYGGGNLGNVNLFAWTATPTAVLYPKIYAHSSARHDGTIAVFPPATAAYINGTAPQASINCSIAFLEVDGLVVYKARTGALLAATLSHHVHNCIFWFDGAGYTNGLMFNGGTLTSNSGVRRFYNNLCYASPLVLGTANPAVTLADGLGSDTLFCYNNTVITNGMYNSGISVNSQSALSLVYNNVAVGALAGQFDIIDTEDPQDGSYLHGATYSNNATSDGYEANYGDAAAQIASNASFASATDFRPAAGSVLIDHGVTIAAVTTDAVGTARPQGSAYDIGGMELLASSSRNRRHGQERGEFFNRNLQV